MTTPIKRLMLAMVAAVALCFGALAVNEDKTWMVIDLRSGACSYYDYDFITATNVFNTEEYKTEKMVFRRVPNGNYFVQNGEETALMTFPYYIGIFPVTEGQYTLICDKDADISAADRLLPKSYIGWGELRGTNLVSKAGEVSVDSPLGELKARTGLDIDLPTVAMWEVAARAIDADDETHKTWNWFFGETSENLWDYAWGRTNSGSNKMPVGEKLPNAWGLYDLYGNVWEWCLDGGVQDADSYGWIQTPRPDDYIPGKAYLDKLAKGGGADGDGDKDQYLNSTFVNRAHIYSRYQRIGFRLAYVCTEALPEYSIQWLDHDGTELYMGSVAYGEWPYYPIDFGDPQRASNQQYEYKFVGWDPLRSPVTGDATYTARYSQTLQEYNITWLDADGVTELFTTNVPYGSMPEFFGEQPSKASTVQYEYSFVGWTPEVEPVTEEATYTAVINEALREYPVNFYNEGGSELLYTVNVPYGSTPEYFGDTPTKPSTAQYHYAFKGWNKEMRTVDGPHYNNYYARFDPVLRSYDIRWLNYDGWEIYTDSVEYGAAPSYIGETPVRSSDEQYEYIFTGWDAIITNVAGEATYTATYAERTRYYNITWRNEDGTLIDVTRVAYGKIPTHSGVRKPNEGGIRYAFSGWWPALEAVTGDAEYIATFREAGTGEEVPAGPVCVAHLSFDDYCNDGLNVLKATVGEDGIVRTTKANVVEGLGEVVPVTDAAILAGLHEGDGAVAIPVNTHIALPIPSVLASESGKPWSITMKVKFPSFGPWYSVFTMPAYNNDDMMVYLNQSSSPTIVLKQAGRDYGSGGFTAGQWETLLFLFDSNNTRVLLNGTEIFSAGYKLAESRANCANAGGYILLAGDNDGEDNLMYWADVKVYDGIVPDKTGLDVEDEILHTVTWKDEDDTVLFEEDVAEGSLPRYKGPTPTKAPDGKTIYVFAGWDTEILPVAGDTVYTATYTATTFDELYDGYIRISTADELNAIRNNRTAKYVLTADIDLSGLNWTPLPEFSGVLDGNGHTISNLTVYFPATDDIGFFKYLRGATVKNLSLRGGKVEGRHRTAGLTARLWGGNLIENVTVDLEVIAYGDTAGGIFCWQEPNYVDRIVRCRSLSAATSFADVDRASPFGGATQGTMLLEDCYATGSATGHGTEGYVGGLVAFKDTGTLTISNCYHRARLQGGYLGGDKVGNCDATANIVDSPAILECFPKNIVNLRTRGSGSGKVEIVNGEFVATPDLGSAFMRFEGLPPKEGDFNETTVWAVFGKAIETEEDLRSITFRDLCKQTADITMTTNTPFYGLCNDPKFKGEYDGDGYAIRNMTINSQSGEHIGLFRQTQGAILKNIHLVGGNVKGGNYVGSLVGLQKAGIVEDCSSSCNVIATGNHGGGLVGYVSTPYSTIRRCSMSGSLTVYGSYAGGLTSYTNGGETKIYDCYSTGDVIAGDVAGGFISHGDNAFVISNCYSTGRVKCPTNIGGFNFRNDGAKVIGCFWDVELSGCAVSGNGTGRTAAEMQTASTFADWDDGVWKIVDCEYPTLWAAPLPKQFAVMKSGVGSGEVEAIDNGNGTYTITATPDENSYFVRWSGTGIEDETSATTMVTVDGNVSATAIFGTLIRTAAELKSALSNIDRYGYYKLVNDIDLENTSARATAQFNGVFDGDGYEIRNINISLPGTEDVALFYALKDATIKNLTLRDGKIEARNRAAGIAARLWGGTLIENCTVDLEVTAYGDSAAGIACWQENNTYDRIVRTRSLSAVTSYMSYDYRRGVFVDRAAGICSCSNGTLILEECYATGSAIGHGTEGYVGGLVAFREYGMLTISNSYHKVRLQGGYCGGDLVGIGDANATIIGSPTILDCFPKNIVNVRTRGNGSGTASYNEYTREFTATPDEGSVFIRWEGLPPEEGDFNETTAWAVFGKAVATESDLRAVTAKGFYKQTADIEMTASPAFYGLCYDPMFQGEYDGDGHGIYNVTIAGNYDHIGLFRRTCGAILKNIHLVGGNVKGGKYVGSLVGWQYAGIVEDCSSSCNVVATDIHAGGLVGVTYANYSTIRRCSASGSVTGYSSYVGGLTSYTNGGETRIYDCYARGDVTANDCAGGFISHGEGVFVISNCYSTGRVKCPTNVGGFNFRDEGAKVIGCFWDTETSGRTTSGSGTGLATDSMKTASNFANWDADVWNLENGEYPTLKGAPAPRVAVVKSGVGGGEVEAINNGNGTYTITATPDENSYFVRWSGTGIEDETSATTMVTVDGNVSATAIFGTLIRTAAELKSALSNIDRYGHYKLVNDIDLENTSARATAQFNGVFDGDGYEIRNINISLPGTEDVALFYALKDATIKNLTLRGGKIEALNRAAGIAARLWGGNLIENCTVDLEITAYGQGVAGIACWQEAANVFDRIVRCRSLSAMESYTAIDRNGGIISGTAGNMLIEECYATGSVTGHGTEGSVGGLAGWKDRGTLTISNCYHRARLQGNYLGGDLYGIGDANATIVGSPTILDDLPKNIVNVRTRGNGKGTTSYNEYTGEFTATPDEGSVFIRWEGLPPEEGDFNETTAWAVFGKAVATESDLRAVTAKGFYKQTADIEMTASPAFAGLCYDPMFQGEYDGDGYGIYNLTIEGNDDYAGLFRRTHGAILKNIHLVGGNVKGGKYVGSLVGWQYAGIVEDCSSSCNVVATDIHGGGLVGVTYANYSTIRRCSASGSVTVYGSYAGGLTSYTNGGETRIYDCYATGDVTAGSWAGGFISHGDGNFIIQSCYSTGKVTAGSNVGGFYFRGDGANKVVGCFWDTDTSELATSGLGYGHSTAKMQTASTFAGWDGYEWYLVDGAYPELLSLMNLEGAYTVTWEDEDGTVLAVEENVAAGCTPNYHGPIPTKAADGWIVYSFAGWDSAIAPVTGDVTYRATYHASRKKTWMTIDLRTGAVGYWDLDFDTATNKFNTEEYKTTKMVFRRVEKGDDYFVQNGAYIANFTNSYYIGLFEVTAGQYALMQDPSAYVARDPSCLRTQGSINRYGVRGMAESPVAFGDGITATSPLGKFNAFVQNANDNESLVFDFPTEAMWEVAARAVESGNEEHKDWKYYFGTDNTDIALYGFMADSNAADDYGITSGMRVPGCRLPNAWGLYDVYGNARDVCLDGHSGEVNNWSLTPYLGEGRYRIWQRDRGGSYDDSITYDSSTRSTHDSGGYGHNGFRLARICIDAEEVEKCTVVWQNLNGEILQRDEIVEGGHVRYHGDTPTMADGEKAYIFKGWTPEVSNIVTGDITYTAVYDSFNISWPDDYKTAGWTLEDDFSLRSKAFDHGGWTRVTLEVTGPGSLTFWWKVSSERNFDFLRFYRGDTPLYAISYITDWIFVSNRVDEAGSVTFKWAYSKDSSGNYYSDCGWIKDIVWIPDAQGTQILVNGQSVELERSEDGKTLTAEVSEGTLAEEVPVKVDGIDVSRGFLRTVEGTVFTATLLDPYDVEKSEGVAEEPWTDDGDGNVTINVEIVPGLYYAAASAASLEALTCPGSDKPATDGTKLVVEKPDSDKQGFYRVWVGDSPLTAGEQ